MKTWISPYQLKSCLGGRRSGYLLKTQAPDQAAGYSDIFPWPEFGDPDFSEIPSLLKSGQTVPLLRQSMYFSRRDAAERTAGGCLLDNKRLKNHHMVKTSPKFWNDEVKKAFDLNFETVKIKIGNDPANEIPALLDLVTLKNDSRWLRLDFNEKGTVDYLDQIQNIKCILQMIEDPFREPTAWGRVDWPWAFDQPSFSEDLVEYDFRVIKPAKQDTYLQESKPVIYTSYLDHPVGMAHAFVEAYESGEQINDYGLMSHRYYEETPFNEYIETEGPWLSFKGNLGIGFDELFAKQEWLEI